MYAEGEEPHFFFGRQRWVLWPKKTPADSMMVSDSVRKLSTLACYTSRGSKEGCSSASATQRRKRAASAPSITR